MSRDKAAVIAGLLTGFIAASVAFLQPPAYLLRAAPILIAAAHAWILVIACASSVAVTLVAGRRMNIDPSGVISASVWFAPAVLFLMEGTMWGVTTVSAAAALTALLFPSSRPERLGIGIFPLLREPEPSFFTPRVRQRMWPAICLASAGVFALAGDEHIAAILCGLFAAFLASRLSSARPGDAVRRRALISTALAVVCTSVALSRYVDFGWGGGEGPYAGGSSTQASSLVPQPRGQGDGGDVPPEGESASLDGTYSGVILWPEEQADTVLVPPLPVLRPTMFERGSPAEPLSIPFFGVYWMYRKPFRQPPPNSYSTKGDPAKMSFRSTDQVPLMMEARQNLGRRFDARCCREIKVAVRNADKYPGTLSLELLLVNTDPRAPAPLSLGRIPVVSTPLWSPAGRVAVPETLAFAVPSNPVPPVFDELRVMFHRSNFGVGRSARVGIDRFTFIRR